MRWAAAGVALVVITVVFATVTSAAPRDPPRVHDGEQSAAPSVPSAVRSFRSVRSYVAVAEPIRLRIAAAEVDTPLQRLGRTPDGSTEVPTDFALAGWFAEGVRPGQPGPAVILGHVDSRSGPAVFYRLARLAVGADVLVDRAGRQRHRLPGEQGAAGPEGRVPHRSRLRADAGAVTEAGDLWRQLRPGTA
jgi:hypothetical protein